MSITKIAGRTLVGVLVSGTFTTSATPWYWRGDGNDWNGTDNPADAANGSWWNAAANGTGAWGYPSASGDAAFVANGKMCVIPAGCTVSGDEMTSIYINTAGAGADGSTLRIDEGATVSGVEIALCGIPNWWGANGNLHLNGGMVTLGNATKNRGLQIGSTSTAGVTGRAWMTGGSLNVSSGTFYVGGSGAVLTANRTRGIFALTNGTVTSSIDVFVGVSTSRYDKAEEATFIQAGGRMSVDPTQTTLKNRKTLYVFGAQATYDMSGGVLDAKVVPAYGGTVRFSGTASYEGNLRLGNYTYEKNIAGFTNTLIVAGGDVSITDLEGGNGMGGEYANLPCRVIQTGGTLTFPGIMGFGNKRFFFEVSGGTCYAGGTGSGNMVTCNRPYFFRIKGTPTVNVAACAGNNGNYYYYQTNSIVEHVIDHRGLAPIIQRSALSLVGHQRLRPDGGVQLVTTNRFELTRTPGTSNLGKAYLVSLPDENLWKGKDFTDANGKAYGCTLNSSAAIAGGSYDGTVTCSARPFGYIDLGSVKTNGLHCLNVALTVAAPEGRTLAASLARVAADLTAAGYSNVVTDVSAERNVSFSIPAERVPDRCAATKLLFDFTETPMPAEGLLAEPGESFYPTVTNALVTAVSLSRNRDRNGLIVVFR